MMGPENDELQMQKDYKEKMKNPAEHLIDPVED
jgi:hypothetical protein